MSQINRKYVMVTKKKRKKKEKKSFDPGFPLDVIKNRHKMQQIQAVHEVMVK